MKEKINELYQSAVNAINQADGLKSLDEVRVNYLGKNGSVTGLLKGMRDVAPEDRPKVGQMVNELRSKIESVLQDKESELKNAELNKSLVAESIDVTLPGKNSSFGSLHPINMVRQ